MYVLDEANAMQRNAIQRKAIFPIYERVNSKGPPPVFVERLIDCDCDIFCVYKRCSCVPVALGNLGT